MYFQELILALLDSGEEGLSPRPAVQLGARREHLQPGHVPARHRPRAVKRRVRGAAASPFGRSLRRQPEPHAAVPPAPGDPQAITARAACDQLREEPRGEARRQGQGRRRHGDRRLSADCYDNSISSASAVAAAATATILTYVIGVGDFLNDLNALAVGGWHEERIHRLHIGDVALARVVAATQSHATMRTGFAREGEDSLDSLTTLNLEVDGVRIVVRRATTSPLSLPHSCHRRCARSVRRGRTGLIQGIRRHALHRVGRAHDGAGGRDGPRAHRPPSRRAASLARPTRRRLTLPPSHARHPVEEMRG